MSPGSRALSLVTQAKSRLARQAHLRAGLRAVTAGALVATAIAATIRAFGGEAGAWPVLGLAATVMLAMAGFTRSRVTLERGALLLDRAAGTRERFLATLAAEDPEVRDLAARQALAITGDRFPLEIPPSADGLVASGALAVLAAVLFLVPSPPAATPDRPPVTGRVASSSVGNGADDEPTEPGRPAAPSPPDDRAVDRVISGENLTEEEWSSLEAMGLARKDRESVEAALAAGDAPGAAETLRRAIAAAREARGADLDPTGSMTSGWEGFARALESPAWSPRFDGLVRRYYAEARGR